MIETETIDQTPGKARTKPRTKKPAGFGDTEDGEEIENTKKDKRRRGPQKRRDAVDDEDDERKLYREMEQLPLGPDTLHLVQHLHEGQRYDHQPRLLPEIDGVTSLSHHEVQVDIKSIQHQLTAFEARSGVKFLEDGRILFLVDENDSDEDMPLAATLKNRRSRPSGVIAPEEIIETLPAARRAVRITQRELRAMRIEREMKRMKKQHDRVTRALRREVVDTAKGLASSRRRTSALQDIMTELEARGTQGFELPEIDEVCVGDRVKCALFGTGRVLELRLDTRQLVVKLDFGGVGYIQEENVEVLPSDMTYAETEEELKQHFFAKIGKLVQPNGKLRMLSGAVDDEDSDRDDESEESSSSEDESGGKKRRLIMTPPPGTSTKKLKNRRVIEFPASTVPIAPYDTGLLISPLSELPERVAAVGPNALQWLPSYLPKNMDEWEQERYNSLQMKGDIERLRFQLQKSEAQRIDAQQLASDQLESINQLVSQLDKLRENAGLPPSNALNPVDPCPTCGSHKTSKKLIMAGVATISGKTLAHSKMTLSETNSRSSRAGDNDSGHSDSKKASKRKHSGADNAEDEAGNESSDAAPPRTTSTGRGRGKRQRQGKTHEALSSTAKDS
ncbi:hypothetical protein GQ600_6161 [Phytophthora cactorum]|nr:hypothetical protein GQ600_6161 [Phytophthora cactorum]